VEDLATPSRLRTCWRHGKRYVYEQSRRGNLNLKQIKVSCPHRSVEVARAASVDGTRYDATIFEVVGRLVLRMPSGRPGSWQRGNLL
jgi:hypothetical protein